MFRRPFARPIRRAMMGEVPPLLRRANELMAMGNYGAAAEAFEQLARGAQMRGIPRDAQLFLQAGRCRILAGQVPLGMTHLKQGLSIIASRGNFQNLQNAGQRAIAELTQRGLSAEAAEIETLLKASIPAGFTGGAVAAAPAAKPRLLPTSCPGCGGPIRSADVEWVDEATAECPYCGSAVRAE
ncbi:MAG: hypothetical protein FJZ96_02660 [Chloroflexi bacterium]|nr:hypothetical protein [Chloroflexota bacterium]